MWDFSTQSYAMHLLWQQLLFLVCWVCCVFVHFRLRQLESSCMINMNSINMCYFSLVLWLYWDGDKMSGCLSVSLHPSIPGQKNQLHCKQKAEIFLGISVHTFWGQTILTLKKYCFKVNKNWPKDILLQHTSFTLCYQSSTGYSYWLSVVLKCTTHCQLCMSNKHIGVFQ